ncbi:unnamed protein product [Spirodela intermedia]|uniref:Uncharacterized protein n=2 Tax=Spirodela intermedia TaxID=51605 RepID=A0A7I8L3J8_SPIIN|nr:unnamed protein product [Spirodela intermedia]CAA6666997.1 unnamed protein product [Spirodela intermedia]CAA7403805.1 unnamed protein product [Spirodela intermedia]
MEITLSIVCRQVETHVVCCQHNHTLC